MPSFPPDTIAPSATLETASEAETHLLGSRIGEALRPGDVITLTGNLGSGKTVLAQGIARGLGVPETVYVTSPTYTLVNRYPGRHVFYHMDLYRISGTADPSDLEMDDILYGDGVCVVEWPDRLPPGALSDHLAVRITPTGPVSRRIDLRMHGDDWWERLQPLIRFWRNRQP